MWKSYYTINKFYARLFLILPIKVFQKVIYQHIHLIISIIVLKLYIYYNYPINH